MVKDLTFSTVCDFIKNDDGELIDTVDSLLGVGIVCAVASVGPTVAPLLAVKNALVKAGEKLLTKMTAKKEDDYIARMQRMEMAYGLICFTAFFEALDNSLPDDLREIIALTPENKLDMVGDTGSVFDEQLPFPNLIDSYQDIQEELLTLYKQLTNNFDKYLELFAEIDPDTAEKMANFRDDLEALPKTAMRYFEGQYFELSRKYEEFRIWVDIGNHKQMSEFQQKFYQLQTETDNKIDIGLARLNETVLTLPAVLREVESQNVVRSLSLKYNADIKAPVIKEQEVIKGDSTQLVFPRICDAFVPQSYKVLRYNSKDIHLEKENTWQEQPIRHELSVFMLKYLSSPHSIEAPLLVLGHPGGGKSLLTKVLAAQLMSDAYTVIRIPLREVNTELGLDTLAADQITKDTGEKITSWANFASQFSTKPLFIILDGFDELLQAKGTVFTGYLDQIKQFQQTQIEQERPVRVMVTSRITLIDKATVPVGTYVVRLLEFNEQQQQHWISIWNKTNKKYFAANKATINPFALPTPPEESKEHDKIMELAEQPLLLLMLALYDAENNDLHKQTNLDRTVLYNSLLRRFIQRERRRYVDGFDHLPDEEKQENKKNKEEKQEIRQEGETDMDPSGTTSGSGEENTWDHESQEKDSDQEDK
ncbi:MAG: ATP-binding protein, partial [Algicola sp.]|nr:ATP-binding protein [Algicola sp.]